MNELDTQQEGNAMEHEASDRERVLEARVDELSEALSTARTQVDREGRLRAIDGELHAAGALDLETARLLAERALEDEPEREASDVVANLRRAKPFLFVRRRSGPGAMAARVEDAGGAMDAAAEQARMTGDRAALLRYLRLKRGG